MLFQFVITSFPIFYCLSPINNLQRHKGKNDILKWFYPSCSLVQSACLSLATAWVEFV